MESKVIVSPSRRKIGVEVRNGKEKGILPLGKDFTNADLFL